MNNDEYKYSNIRNYIVDLIKQKSMKPGDKIPSEYTLIDIFGYSRHTVRQALSILVSEGVLYKSQGKGTFVARQKKEKKSKTIALMLSYIDSYIFPFIISGIEKVLKEHGYNFFLYKTDNNPEKEKECLIDILNRDIDGLIAEPSRSYQKCINVDLYKNISGKNIPVLFIHGYYKELKYSYLIEDDYLGGKYAGQYLASNKCKNILGIFKNDDIQGVKREKGFIESIKDKNIKYKIIHYKTGDMEKAIEKSFNRIKNEVFDGMVTYNDMVLYNLYLKVHEIKNIENICIASFDDSGIIRHIKKDIFSVKHTKEEFGNIAAKIILDMIDGKTIHIEKTIKPQTIINKGEFNNE